MTGVLADEPMSDLDAVVWRIDRRPRNRTTIAALARFDRPLDATELWHCVDHASRAVPRLRQRVVADEPTSSPRWRPDPDFRLSRHLRHLDLDDADDPRLVDLVRDIVTQPFDRARPLWEVTRITGLEGGRSALLLKVHHALSDGVGGVELALHLFAPSADPEAQPAARPRETRTPCLAAPPTDALTALTATSRALGEAVGSAVRLFAPRPGPRVVPASRSAGLDLRFLAVPLGELRRAGRRAGGTINDAFVSAVALGIARHFGDDRPAGSIRISIPVSTRTTETGTEAAAVGNHWTPGRIEVNLRLVDDCDRLMEHVGRATRAARAEPVHRVLGPLASGLRHLPSPATTALFDTFSSGLDIAASNVPGTPFPLRLCGQQVDALIPFGPLSGCAVNATLLSHADTAHIGVASDPAAVEDPDLLLRDLECGFATLIGSRT